MTTLNTLTVINAAEKADLFAAMREIKALAPEVAETMIENCTQHFNDVLAHIVDGADESTIGTKFGCGEIDSYELFKMVSGQAFEDLQIYVDRRDAAPIELAAECILVRDRLLNAFTGKYEEVTSAFMSEKDIAIKTADDSRFILPFGLKVTLKR